MVRGRIRNTALTLAAALALGAVPVLAQGTLRVGMTASDIPLTIGQTDQGGERMRFMGYTVYDSLMNWDLTSADAPLVLIPGLAREWTVADDQNDLDLYNPRGGKVSRQVRIHGGSGGLEFRHAA